MASYDLGTYPNLVKKNIHGSKYLLREYLVYDLGVKPLNLHSQEVFGSIGFITYNH